MAKKKFKKLKDVAFKGALTVEATRLIPHAGNAGFLSGTSVPGFIGLGVAGKTSDIALDLITGKNKTKRKKKRRK